MSNVRCDSVLGRISASGSFLRFMRFDLQPEVDYITIYSCGNRTEWGCIDPVLLGNYTGAGPANLSTPVYSPSGIFQVCSFVSVFLFSE